VDHRLHPPHGLSHSVEIGDITCNEFDAIEAFIEAAVEHAHVMLVAEKAFYKGASDRPQPAGDEDVHRCFPFLNFLSRITLKMEAGNFLEDHLAILAYFKVILFGLRHSQETISKLSGGLCNDT
jgi:hypothetical protein